MSDKPCEPTEPYWTGQDIELDERPLLRTRDYEAWLEAAQQSSRQAAREKQAAKLARGVRLALEETREYLNERRKPGPK